MFAQKFDEKIKHDYNDFNPVNRKSHMENQRMGGAVLPSSDMLTRTTVTRT